MQPASPATFGAFRLDLGAGACTIAAITTKLMGPTQNEVFPGRAFAPLGGFAEGCFMKKVSALIIAIFCSFVVSTFADGDEHWDDQFGPPGADNAVFAMTPSGSDLYVGGFFT